MTTSYRDLDVWKCSLLLNAEVYRVTTRLPPDERFGLTAQMRRAAVSITCNIAEGYGRSTRGEYLNHLSMARGSLNEVEALCAICTSLNLLKDEALAPVSGYVDRMRRMLGRLRMRLTERKSKR
jgi:four helix bundle protein